MASALSKQRDYKYMADKYTEVNESQVKYGMKLVALVGVKKGDKVLDMGCGTGEITAFIADQVVTEGQVVGVDPDQERINIAVRKHCNAKRNITFIEGDSSSHFPHFNEQHYDIHYSSFVYHWLNAQEKEVFFKTAFDCLKPGGRIAIQSTEKPPEIFLKVPELLPDDEVENNRTPFQAVQKSVTESMLEKSGFVILSSDFDNYDVSFPSLDDYLAWYCASGYFDGSKILPHKKEEFTKTFLNKDGKVYLDFAIFRIIAKKLDNIVSSERANEREIII